MENITPFQNNDFSKTARTALIYIVKDLINKCYLVDLSEVILELNRTGRFTEEYLDQIKKEDYIDQLTILIYKLQGNQVYRFCERLYSKLLTGIGNDDSEWYVSIEEVQKYFSDEINLILKEENFDLYFSEGHFKRIGRAQTQKAFERVGAVLINPNLESVKNHYNKARRFFDKQPKPDPENCVKEALCALEASIEILTDKKASKEFEKVIKQLEGNGQKQIPPPIGEGMIKLHSYRGSGQGVSHASTHGNRVELIDAELVLSLVASYITYLVDLFPFEEDIPF